MLKRGKPENWPFDFWKVPAQQSGSILLRLEQHHMEMELAINKISVKMPDLNPPTPNPEPPPDPEPQPGSDPDLVPGMDPNPEPMPM